LKKAKKLKIAKNMINLEQKL